MVVPLNMTSSISLPLISLAEDSPIIHFKASTIFDLPQPLGPTIPVKPLSIFNSVLSTNDLNPEILNLLKSIFIYSISYLKFFQNL